MMDSLLPLVLVLSTLFTITLILLPTRYHPQNDGAHNKASVQILVLGDIGRSPRMQYHALSIAKHGGRVQLVGYLDTEPLPELRHHSNVTIIPLPTSPAVLQTSRRILFLAVAPVKVLLQVWNLWQVLGYQTSPAKWLLVQNPPSIPTLLIAVLIGYFRRTKLVIDWHNFGYSILALKLGDRHPLVQVSRWYETKLAKAADSNFAVTDVMRSLLQKQFVGKAPVLTLHDRPAAIFQPLSETARIAFISQHAVLAEHFEAITNQKTRLVVSSTSWTPDEDFAVLLEALCRYSASATSTSPQLPELLVVITGKGPQKEYYMQKVKALKDSGDLEMVTIKTAWLSFEDYAGLLASADLGVSLHTSSSGVDLPMKVVDMFGAGLPVLGFDNFKAWSELVTEKVNGRGFSSSATMSDILEELFEPGNKDLTLLRMGAIRESERRWDDEWDSVAGKLFGLAK